MIWIENEKSDHQDFVLGWAVTSRLYYLPCLVFRQGFSHQLIEEHSEDKKPTTSRYLFSMTLQPGTIMLWNPHFSLVFALSLLHCQTPVGRMLLKIVHVNTLSIWGWDGKRWEGIFGRWKNLVSWWLSRENY